jgi:RNA polymerase sigma-70 factor (ECF subfamily)
LLLCLDEESRKIVELYYFDEFSVKEIGNLLEMNSNTVSTKLSRARAKLKKVIRR